MKTERHPFSKKIHLAMGGSITYFRHKTDPRKDRVTSSAFRTACGRRFKQGHSELMLDWGQVNAKSDRAVTCKQCRIYMRRARKETK